jgi:hypothetical protein
MIQAVARPENVRDPKVEYEYYFATLQSSRKMARSRIVMPRQLRMISHITETVILPSFVFITSSVPI